MKALWITGNYLPQIGGLQVYIDQLIHKLSERMEVALLTEAGQDSPSSQYIAHFTAQNLTRPRGVEEWQRAADEIADAIAAFEPDIVHFSNANVAVYRPIVPENVRTVASVHGNDLTAPWQYTPGEDLTNRIVDGLNGCEHIFAVSNHSAELVRRWGVETACSVITSGCDIDFFRPLPGRGSAVRKKYGIPAPVPLLLTVARLVPRKGHANVLEALQRMPLKAHWMVVGDGPMREALMDAVEASGMRERVTLAGEISNQELRELYNVCDVFVLTPEERAFGGWLDSEGFGLAFHEAGACRKPVIGSEISGAQEAVVHGITGLIVAPEQPQELADALERILTEPGLAQTLGRGGLALVRLLGGWARVALQLHEAYECVLNGKAVQLVPQ